MPGLIAVATGGCAGFGGFPGAGFVGGGSRKRIAIKDGKVTNVKWFAEIDKPVREVDEEIEGEVGCSAMLSNKSTNGIFKCTCVTNRLEGLDVWIIEFKNARFDEG